MYKTLKSLTAFIGEDVILEIEKRASLESKYETGGIIGGYGSVEEGKYYILKSSDSGPKAQKQHYFFSRDTQYCQAILDGWAKNSLGKIDYLGEWHKHYEDDPRPSNLDIDTMKSIAKSNDYHVNEGVLIIIGKSSTRNNMKIFIVDQKGRTMIIKWKLVIK